MHNEKQKAKSAAPDWPRLTVLRVNTHQHTQQHLFRFLSFFPADATRETVTFSSPVCPGAVLPWFHSAVCGGYYCETQTDERGKVVVPCCAALSPRCVSV